MLTAAAGISSATGSWLPAMGRDRGSTTGSLKRPQSSPEKGSVASILAFLQRLSLWRHTSWVLELYLLFSVSKQEVVSASSL